MANFRGFGIAILLCLTGILLPCKDALLHAAAHETSQSNKQAGFRATITGAYEGEVSGNGVLVLLPEAGFDKQGYCFLADGRGIRPHGVTFILPREMARGRYPLKSLSPLDIGTVPSVRVDRGLGDSVISVDKNTSGFLELDAFPSAGHELSGSDLRGSFEFETEHVDGRMIKVKGDFSFQAK